MAGHFLDAAGKTIRDGSLVRYEPTQEVARCKYVKKRGGCMVVLEDGSEWDVLLCTRVFAPIGRPCKKRTAPL